MNNLPNLLVIGAMKAGTTSFHEMLNQHPDIFMSEVKELNFFIDEMYNSKDIEWYRVNFVMGESSKIRGESSVSYTKRHRFPNVPENIYKTLGKEIRLIYILRDPITRFQSNFSDSKTYGHIPANVNVNEFLNQRPLSKLGLVMTGCYNYQLIPFLENFSKENILLLEYEDLFSNTGEIMRKVFDFLEVKYIEFEMPVLNKSTDKQYENETLRKLKKARLVTNIIPKNIKKVIYETLLFSFLFKEDVNNPKNLLSLKSIDILREYYLPELESLNSTFGFMPKHWKYFS